MIRRANHSTIRPVPNQAESIEENICVCVNELMKERYQDPIPPFGSWLVRRVVWIDSKIGTVCMHVDSTLICGDCTTPQTVLAQSLPDYVHTRR